MKETEAAMPSPTRPGRLQAPDPFPWAGSRNPDYVRYMCEEWGVPVHDDRRLFEMLALECFQAGLSWATILKRRQAFRRAFSNWNLSVIAAYGSRDRARLRRDPGIIRNARKIEAVIANAAAALKLRREFGSLDAYFWGFIGGRPITRNKGRCRRWQDLPCESEESRRLARDLKARGFRFVGPVACYAFMQAVGLVDDRL